MKLIINGVEDEVPNGLTVKELLSHKQVEMPDMVSVELNGIILERKAYETTVLKEGDRVEFLYFMGGGQVRGGKSEPTAGRNTYLKLAPLRLEDVSEKHHYSNIKR